MIDLKDLSLAPYPCRGSDPFALCLMYAWLQQLCLFAKFGGKNIPHFLFDCPLKGRIKTEEKGSL